MPEALAAFTERTRAEIHREVARHGHARDIDPGFGPDDDGRHWPAPGGRMRDSLFWELIMPEEKLGLQIYLYVSHRGLAGYNVSVWGRGMSRWP